MPDDAESPIVPKKENSRENSSFSGDSVVDVDAEGELDGLVEGQSPPPVVPQKRKGGRKPIYATSEERKQRNRQAQAAFRERRTEYIKQLEADIRQRDEQLQTLQQSHRSTTDECLMLRYKNSLLERILLEKGIDVQAELKRKEVGVPSRAPPILSHAAPIPRSTSGRPRHMHRLSSGSNASIMQQAQRGSPRIQSSPSSQVTSPTTTKSPTFGIQGGMNLTHPGFQAQQQPQQQQQLQPQPLRSATFPSISEAATRPGLQPIAPNLAGQRPNHWPSPFQAHNEQLEREYGTTSEMLDVDDNTNNEDVHTGPGPYPQYFQQQQAFSVSQAGFAMPVTSNEELRSGVQGGFGQLFDAADPMLDADPFGLSASMHFPTPFSFQESSMRK